MNDRIRELDVFLRVAEAASFSAAARNLDCNASTVSKLIRRLEDRLGVRLFHRTSRVLRLSPEGQRFLEGARRAIDALQDAEDSVGQTGVEATGVLRVSSTLAFVDYHVRPYIAEFVERYPRIRVEFLLTVEPVNLFERQIDISLQSGYIPDSSLIAKRIATSRWIICASPEYLKKAGVPRTPAELRNHNCLNFLPGSYRSTWLMRDGSGEVEPDLKGNLKSNSPYLLRSFACEGLGIARLSELHIGHDLASGRLVPLLEKFHLEVEEPVFAIYASRRNLSPRIKVFLDFLSEKLAAAPAAKTKIQRPRSRSNA